MKFIFNEIQIRFIALPALIGILIGYLFSHNFILRSELQLSNRYKTEFLSKISHEIRTPLNAIIGFTQILSLKNKNKSQNQDYEYIQHIQESSAYLLDLVNELLDLSRIESGKIKFFKSEIILNELLLECMNSIQHLSKEKNINFYYKPGKETLMVFADRMRLKQVFINLLSNSIKYNKNSGSVHISISSSENGENIQVNIADSGTGIPEENMKDIFEPFHRLAIHKDIEGTGIGLSLSKKIMLSQGGDIRCESSPGLGTKFIVYIRQQEKETIHDEIV